MHHSSKILICLAALASTVPVSGQSVQRITISGRVIDDSTAAAIYNVNVFLSHTSLGCSTDSSGRFEIKNVPSGSYELVASRVGFQLYSSRIQLNASEHRQFSIRLRPTSVNLREVVISAPEPTEWKGQLKKFTKLFLGTSRNAQQCRILNPEILDFKDVAGFFSATARAPIEIENKALGYHIQFYLTLFKVEPENPILGLMPGSPVSNGILTYEGKARYLEIDASAPDERTQWQQNRARAFKSSFRYFLISLLDKALSAHGFAVYNIDRLSASDLNRTELKEDAMVFPALPGHQQLFHFKKILEVEYKRSLLDDGYDLLRKKGTDAQTSWVELNYDVVTVDSRGLIKEWFPTKLYGYWAWQRLADALPLDYDFVED